MEQYIPKSVLVAEIERIKKEECPIDTYEGRIKLFYFERFLSFLDTIKMKEIDLDTEQRQYLTKHFNVYDDGILQSKKSQLPLSTYDVIKVAKYFFELGMAVSNKTQKGKDI